MFLLWTRGGARFGQEGVAVRKLSSGVGRVTKHVGRLHRVVKLAPTRVTRGATIDAGRCLLYRGNRDSLRFTFVCHYTGTFGISIASVVRNCDPHLGSCAMAHENRNRHVRGTRNVACCGLTTTFGGHVTRPLCIGDICDRRTRRGPVRIAARTKRRYSLVVGKRLGIRINRRDRILKPKSDVCFSDGAPRNVVTINNRSYAFCTVILGPANRPVPRLISSVGPVTGIPRVGHMRGSGDRHVCDGCVSIIRGRGNAPASVAFGGARGFGFNFSLISRLTGHRPRGLTLVRVSGSNARETVAFASIGGRSGHYTGCFGSLNVGGNSEMVLMLGHRCRF